MGTGISAASFISRSPCRFSASPPLCSIPHTAAETKLYSMITSQLKAKMGPSVLEGKQVLTQATLQGQSLSYPVPLVGLCPASASLPKLLH